MDAPPVQYARTDDGYNIAYTVCGNGPPLLVTPAPFNHALNDWDQSAAKGRWLTALSQRFRLIHYDSRGQGLSSRGLRPGLSMEDYEKDLEAVVTQTGLRRFVLLGFLTFSHVAMRYASTHREQVEALILLNGRADGGAGSALAAFGDLARNDWEGFLEVMSRTTSSIQDPVLAKRRARETITQADYLMQTETTSASNVKDVAASLTVPTLLLAADSAAWNFGTEAAARELAGLIADSRMVLFGHTNAGIYAPSGETPPNIAAIEAFLADVASREAQRPSTMTRKLSLSARELDVLRLIIASKTSREIAETLVLSIRTVERHIANIYAKTDTHGRVQVTQYALSNGLV